jgi:acyl dehydratase
MARAGGPAAAIDTSDLDRYLGKSMGGGQLAEPVAVNDIRRFAQGMQYPNPLHYDADYAAKSRFGRIVAPQSFSVGCDIGHGAMPSVFGRIPGQHMLFGGDEWWFYGPRIFPGDRITTDGMLYDYKVTHTKFAGPTMFSRGDTNYVNQRGEFVAKQRSTSIRYRAEDARRMNSFGGEESDPEWSAADLEAVQRQKMEYYESFLSRGHALRSYDSVDKGDRLPRCVIGPHSVASFTTEHRSRPTAIWGATLNRPGPSSLWNAGWIPEMSRDHAGARVNPELGDGLYHGPSRGHVQPQFARLIGMPRGYGYGSTMGGWVLDSLENWSGEWGCVRHIMMQYRNPAFTGDVTYIDGNVGEKAVDASTGWKLVTIHLNMTNQKGAQLARGYAEVELADPEKAPAA